MECAIDTGEDTKFFGGSVDQYLKQVYNIAKGESEFVWYHNNKLLKD